MSLVYDEKVPSLLPYPLPHILLLGVVYRGNDLRRALPWIRQLMLIDGGKDDVEWLAKPAEHLVLPLDRKRSGAKNEDAFNRFSQLQLLHQQPGHDRFAGARIIRQKKTQPGLRQHSLVDRFNLVRQGANTGKTNCELLIMSISQSDTSGLDQKSEFLGINRDRFISLAWSPANDVRNFFC